MTAPRFFGLRGSILATLALLLALVGVLAIAAAPVLAARGHAFEKTFGSAGSGDGQLKEPAGVAVNEATGDVYVVDEGDNRVEWFSAAGSFEGQFNGSGTDEVKGKVEIGTAAPTGSFSQPQEIAVDNSCRLHNPELTELTFPSCHEYDPSNGDVYVVDFGHHVIDKFSPTGQYLSQVTGTPSHSFVQLYGVAVDSKGELWVDYELPPALQEKYAAAFSNESTNSYLEGTEANLAEDNIRLFGFMEPGLAVDAEDNLYVKGFFAHEGPFSRRVMKLNSRSDQRLIEEVGKEPGGWPAVEVSSQDSYIGQADRVGRYTSEGALVEHFGEGHLTSAAGVAVDTTSESVYVADASADDVAVFSLEPPEKPTLEAESVSDVASTSATFNAEVNPRGPSSEYRFEYGPCATLAVGSCASSPYDEQAPTPDGSLGSGWPEVAVSQHVQDLQPHTTYHVRVVVRNELGEVQSQEETFTTQTARTSFELPDNRQWELVSPANMHGAFMEPIADELTQASADGNAFVGSANVPTEAQAPGNPKQVDVLSVRGADGWVSKDISTSHNSPPGATLTEYGTEYRFFSEDLSRAIVQPFGGAFSPLSPEASEQTAYLRSDFPAGDSADMCAESCYTPLVSAGNVPAGTHFGEPPKNESEENEPCETYQCGPIFVGATPDAEHIVLRSKAQLTETPTPGGWGLYEWTAGRLQLVSVLPPGETNENGGQAAFEAYLGEHEREFGGFFEEDGVHAISNDGSRVIFMADPTHGGPVHLYLRDTATEETVLVSAGGKYMTASSDASKVFFVNGGNLEVFEVTSGEGEPLAGRVVDLTIDPHAGESSGVAQVLGTSEDDSYIYFTAAGALAEGASPGECGEGESPVRSERLCNLYVWHEGVTTFIAGLSQGDFPDWAHHDNGLTDAIGRVSPNGRWLAFMSQRSLTGYDNTDAVSGQPDEEVFLYHAASTASEAGGLVCASCNPTGARPSGAEYAPEGRQIEFVGGRPEMWLSGQWLAALVPPWTGYELVAALHQSRYLANSGRLFFDSRDPLVPQDVGGNWGVYEYEPPGVGTCAESSSTYSERVGGCQSLISSPTAREESAFLDASESGGDVFFLTTEKLVEGDLNSAAHVYDARECTASASCFPTPSASPPPCETGEACKSAPNVQPTVFGAPPSATFSGAGDLAPTPTKPARKLTRGQKLAKALKACAKKRKRKRAKCEAQARRRYGGAARRAGKLERTGR